MIVTASMGPIHAARVRWDRMVPANLRPVTVVGASARVAQEHPITMAMREQLPLLDDVQLAEVRTHLLSRGSRADGAMSTAADVDAWVAMVDDETRHRARLRTGAMMNLMRILGGTPNV